MKKYFFAFLMLASVAISCTPENQISDEQQIDKHKVCPPGDRNCNGILDNQE
ncbi:hypothetical protein [Aequorivita nionensis]|jgi:hypothetical protein|uniref:hypothetical protein n=1 Tax=Aequorivita nionensis TaxID=1287690 RepID=UPI003965A09F